MLLVGLTGEDRISWYDPAHITGNDDPWNNYVHSTWLDEPRPDVDAKWYEMKKNHIAMSACDELGQLNYETTVRMFDGVSSRYGIPVVQFNTVASTMINGIETLYDLQLRNVLTRSCYAKRSHPNEKGHKLIANSLIKVIDKISKTQYNFS